MKLSCLIERGSWLKKLKQSVLKLSEGITLPKNICISIRVSKPTQMKACLIPSDNLGLVCLKNNGIRWYKNQIRSLRFSGNEEWIFLILQFKPVVGRAEHTVYTMDLSVGFFF